MSKKNMEIIVTSAMTGRKRRIPLPPGNRPAGRVTTKFPSPYEGSRWRVVVAWTDQHGVTHQLSKSYHDFFGGGKFIWIERHWSEYEVWYCTWAQFSARNKKSDFKIGSYNGSLDEILRRLHKGTYK